jgi:hypothetical protein
MVFFSACSCPQVLVTVPDFSAKVVAGNTTSAISAVSVGKISATSTNAGLLIVSFDIPNVFTGFDPKTNKALI